MISNQIVKTRYIGNGVTRTFPINFAYTDKSQVKLLIAIDQEETIISPNDYNITGGNVIYPANQERQPAAAGTVVLVYRETPQTQETDFTNQGGAWPETIEKSLDKLTQEVQEQSEKLSRCIATLPSSKFGPEELTVEAIYGVRDATLGAAARADNSALEALEASAAAKKSEEEANIYKEMAGQSVVDAQERASEAIEILNGIEQLADAAKGHSDDAARSAFEAQGVAQSVLNYANEASAFAQQARDSANMASTSKEGSMYYADLAYQYTEPLRRALSNMFEYDENADVQLVANPILGADSLWEVDENGDVMPSDLTIAS